MHQSEVGPFVSKARALISELGKLCSFPHILGVAKELLLRLK